MKPNFVKGEFIFENALDSYNGTRIIQDIVVTYTGEWIDTIDVGTREITFTNDGTNYTLFEDSEYEFELNYDGDGKFTGITTTKK